jgi:hypothetical protein
MRQQTVERVKLLLVPLSALPRLVERSWREGRELVDGFMAALGGFAAVAVPQGIHPTAKTGRKHGNSSRMA